jgi:hypothetical protein
MRAIFHHRAILRAPVFLVCSLAGAGATHSSWAQPRVPEPKVSATVSFRCLWWSEEQMNGLNPNSPPPKNTEVRIEKWEYSDPIGVPHPDVVDVVVELRNEGEVKAGNLVVDVSAFWMTGPQKSKARARWERRVSLRRFSAVSLEARAAQTLRVGVNVAEKMKKLRATRSWPWTLRAQITVSTASGKLLAKTTADLPITPGD